METIINKLKDLIWSLEGGRIIEDDNPIMITLSLSESGIEKFRDSVLEEHSKVGIIHIGGKPEFDKITEYKIPYNITIKLQHNGK